MQCFVLAAWDEGNGAAATVLIPPHVQYGSVPVPLQRSRRSLQRASGEAASST